MSVLGSALNRLLGLVLLIAITGCGGGGHSSPPPSSVTVPGSARELVANVGDGAVSLGWLAPASDGGAPVQGYEVTLTPAVAASDIFLSGTRALVRNLSNGTSYVAAVTARNSAGAGLTSQTPSVTPHALDPANYVAVPIDGDTSASGVFDPAVLRLTNGDLWLSYSSVHYYNDANGRLVQDVGIRLARSTNGGASFAYQTTIASPSPATVTDTHPSHNACGATTCTGRWVYETSWLVEDGTDPDPARRFKLFAHKYFLNPASAAKTLYHLGTIVMWTAPAPDAAWSPEMSLLGWSLTPPELIPLRIVNSLHADLAACLTVAEGSAVTVSSALDFVFACPYVSGNSIPQKIVMLRSRDHANTFEYVATLLTPEDAASIGAGYFTAPSVTVGNAPLLLVTPTFNGLYAGCVAIPFADLAAGSLFRQNGLPVGILYAPAAPDHFGGACSYDPGLGVHGILQNDGVPGASPTATRFAIRSTGSPLQVRQ